MVRRPSLTSTLPPAVRSRRASESCSNEPTFSVAATPSVTLPLGSAVAVASRSVPDWTVVGPESVLVPRSTSRPSPDFTNPDVPVTAEITDAVAPPATDTAGGTPNVPLASVSVPPVSVVVDLNSSPPPAVTLPTIVTDDGVLLKTPLDVPVHVVLAVPLSHVVEVPLQTPIPPGCVPLPLQVSGAAAGVSRNMRPVPLDVPTPTIWPDALMPCASSSTQPWPEVSSRPLRFRIVPDTVTKAL